jgi:hypothetical protein
MPYDIIMQAKNRTRRTTPSSFKPRSQRAKPRLDQEAIDDQKFQQKLDAKRFTAGIVREANEQLQCPDCGSSTWRMKPIYYVNWVANELVATMVCRKCKRSILHGTHIEKDPEEEDEEESDDLPFGIFGTGSRPRRRRKLDIDQRLRLLRFL